MATATPNSAALSLTRRMMNLYRETRKSALIPLRYGKFVRTARPPWAGVARPLLATRAWYQDEAGSVASGQWSGAETAARVAVPAAHPDMAQRSADSGHAHLEE